MRSIWKRGAAAAVAGAALAAAGVAAAGGRTTSASLVSASFYANTAGASSQGTCTGANGDTYSIADATYAGSASSSDPNLNGSLTIRARSVTDTNTNVGWLVASVRIAGSSAPAAFHGRLAGVLENGAVQGFVTGTEAGGGHLAGGVNAAFSPASGFASSSSPALIGSGTIANEAVVLTSGACTAPKPPAPPHWPHPVKPLRTPHRATVEHGPRKGHGHPNKGHGHPKQGHGHWGRDRS